jgi:predicted nucleic acid-binding Zn ribbon protein
MTVPKGYFCAEKCRGMLLEVGKKVKQVKRVMVDVIALVKNVVSDVP